MHAGIAAPAISALFVMAAQAAIAGQVPGAASAADIPMSARDRVYAAEQFSNTVSVTDPASNRLLGVIRLGDPQPANFSPLYHGQLLVHGMGFSPDHRTLVVVSIGSNAVSFIDTATNAVRHTTYVGRSPHEAFFTPDGGSVWVTVRGDDYVAVIDAHTYTEAARIKLAPGPGMQIFSPDGQYAYVCSSFTPDTAIIRVADHQVIGHVKQDSPFCPNIAATPDGSQVWLTLKDVGRVMVFQAQPPFAVLASIATGPITNHVNFVRTARGQYAYVTVGGLNEVKVFRTRDFSLATTIPVGKLPHGIWPSGDGTRVYVGLENGDALAIIDTATNTVIGSIPIGQAPQALAYVPNAVPEGPGTQGLVPLGVAGAAAHFVLVPRSAARLTNEATSVALFDQGLIQIVQASVTGLVPRASYVIALAGDRYGRGAIQPLARFTTNPAGSAIVDAEGPIRQLLHGEYAARRYLVIVPWTPNRLGAAVQIQQP
jgi:YVTN family beta-propeller protein